MNKKTQNQQTVQNKKAGLMTAPTLMAASVAMASASQAIAEDNWKANPEVFYTGGSDRWYAGGQILYPLKQSDTSLTYADLRFIDSRYDASEYNIGVGHRVLGDGSIMGGYLSYDRRETGNDNDFNQITLGLEYLAESFDVNFNYYSVRTDAEVIFTPPTTTSNTVSTTDTQSVTDLTASEFSGNELLATYQTTETSVTTNQTRTYTTAAMNRYEEALSGYDLEVGYLLPISDDMETRLYLAAYDFDAEETNYVRGTPVEPEDASGVRARLVFRPQKALAIEAAYQDDDLFGHQMFGSVTYSFGYEGKGQRSLSERMVELHQRDIDIVTTTNIDEHGNTIDAAGNFEQPRIWSEDTTVVEDPVVTTTTETAAIDENGDGEGDNVIHIDNSYEGGDSDGTAEKPFVNFDDCYDDMACDSADIIYVHQGNSAEAGSEYDRNLTIELEDYQMLVGEGTDFFGLGEAGLFPVITNTFNNRTLVELANSNTVTGLNLQAVGDGDDEIVTIIHGENVRYTNINNNQLVDNTDSVLASDTGATGIHLEYDFGDRNSGLRDGMHTSAQITNNLISGMTDNDNNDFPSGMGVVVETMFSGGGEFTQIFNFNGTEVASNEGHGVLIRSWSENQAATLNQHVKLGGALLRNNDGDGIYVEAGGFVGYYGLSSIGFNIEADLRNATIEHNNQDGFDFRSEIYLDGSLGLADNDIEAFTNLTIKGDANTSITNNDDQAIEIDADIYSSRVENASLHQMLDLDLQGVTITDNNEGIDIDQNIDVSQGIGISTKLVQNVNIQDSNISDNAFSDGFELRAYIQSDSTAMAMSELEQNVTIANSNFDSNSGGLEISAGMGNWGYVSEAGPFMFQQNIDIANSTFNNNASDGIYINADFSIAEVNSADLMFAQNVSIYNVEVHDSESNGLTVESWAYLDGEGQGRNTFDIDVDLSIVNSSFSTPTGSDGIEIDFFSGVDDSQKSTITDDINIYISGVSVEAQSTGIDINTGGGLEYSNQSVVTRNHNFTIKDTNISSDYSDGLYIWTQMYGTDNFGSEMHHNFNVDINNVTADGVERTGLEIYFETDMCSVTGGMVSHMSDISVTNSSFANGSNGVYIEDTVFIGSSPALTSEVLSNISLYNVNVDNSTNDGVDIEQGGELERWSSYSEHNWTFNIDLQNISAVNTDGRAFDIDVYAEGGSWSPSWNDGNLFSAASNINLNNIDASGANSLGVDIGQWFGSEGEGNIVDFALDVNVSNVDTGVSDSKAIAVYQEIYICGENNIVTLTDNTSITDNTVNSRFSHGISVYQHIYIGDGDTEDGRFTNDSTLTVTGNTVDAQSEGISIERLVYIGSNDIERSWLDFSTTQTIADNTVTTANGVGIYLENDFNIGSNNEYIDVTWELMQDITGNTVENAGSDGMHLHADFRARNGSDDSEFAVTHMLNVADNTVTSSDGDGIEIGVEMDVYSSVPYDRSVFNSMVTIANNNISGNGADGIEFWSTMGGGDSYSGHAQATQTIEVTNNQVTGNGKYGLYLDVNLPAVDLDQTVTIDGNNFNESGSTYGGGISISNSGVYQSELNRTLTITNNMLNDAAQHGVELWSSIGSDSMVMDSILIENNQVVGSGKYGITVGHGLYGSDSSLDATINILNNTATGGGGGVYAGVWASGGDTESNVDLSIAGNALDDNQWGGIWISSGAQNDDDMRTMNASINNNTITGNDGDGVTFMGYGDNAYMNNTMDISLKNNDISNNDGNGVNMFASMGMAIEASLANNNISDNAGHGIYLWADSGAVPQLETGMKATIDLGAREGGNTVENNLGSGVFIDTEQTRDMVTVNFKASAGNVDNSVHDNIGDDFEVSVYSAAPVKVIDDEGNKL